VTLARGLNYYTGAIFEVAAPEGVKMGSIGGGGRYDDLTGIGWKFYLSILVKMKLYMHRREIPYVVLTGGQEVANGTYTLKNMDKGTQETLSLDAMINHITN